MSRLSTDHPELEVGLAHRYHGPIDLDPSLVKPRTNASYLNESGEIVPPGSSDAALTVVLDWVADDVAGEEFRVECLARPERGDIVRLTYAMTPECRTMSFTCHRWRDSGESDVDSWKLVARGLEVSTGEGDTHTYQRLSTEGRS